MSRPRRIDDDLLAAPYRTLIREVSPSTPSGAAATSVAGDTVTVAATLVRDGHDVLAARVRWRRRPGRTPW